MTTLIDTFEERCGDSRSHGRAAFTFLDYDGQVDEELTYGQLQQRARAVAALLRSCVGTEDRVLLVYPPGLSFITAFIGCLYARAIAVPAYPPDPARRDRTLPRFLSTLRNAQPQAALSLKRFIPVLRELLEQSCDTAPQLLATDDDELPTGLTSGPDADISSRTPAFLQYTSGSTSDPKGTIITHGNLMHNQRAIHEITGMTSEQTLVSWLPQYHDMGLVGATLHPLYCGARSVLMAPTTFIRHPVQWLQAITRFKGSVTASPSFAFDLCVRRVREEDLSGLDLSSWEAAINGSEPVRFETIERFIERFKRVGFRPEAMRPCYGLAEHTLIISGKKREGLPAGLHVDCSDLSRGRVTPISRDKPGLMLSSAGTVLGDIEAAIVDPQSGERLPDGQVGEIWVRSGSVAGGYWNNERETRDIFTARLADSLEGPFLKTGDLGFLHQGELFVTGRIKDVVILRGCNHYPQDIEYVVQQAHPAVRPGCCAAFSVSGASGLEELVLAAELDSRKVAQMHSDIAPLVEITDAIRAAVVNQIDIRPNHIELLEPGTIPKTSSGKIARHLCKAHFTKSRLARFQSHHHA